MFRLLTVLVLLAPALARADYYPYVNKGPAILGVTQTEAWVTWYTAHHEGTASIGNECFNDPILQPGSPNGSIPTLTLQKPGVGGSTWEDPTCSRYHKVHLVNLLPDTHYTFTLDREYVSGGPVASGEFTTAPATSGGTVHFVVYGDTRDEPFTSPSTRPDHQKVADAIVARESNAAFLINTGDLALNTPAVSGDDNGYTEYFEVERALLAARPIFVAYGNHESIDSTFFDGLMNVGMLTTPQSSHPYYFSFDWGPVHVAVLDSFEGTHSVFTGNAPALTAPQAAWLDADLTAARGRGMPQVFVVSHQGAYSHPNPNDTNAHGGGPDVQQRIVPLMIKYGALGLFAGHDHYYQRGREDCTGYYVIGGGGAPMYDPDPSFATVAVTLKQVSYLAVTATPSGATGDAYDTAGTLLDHFDFQTAGCNLPDGGTPMQADASTPVDSDASVVGADAATSGEDVGVVTAADAAVVVSGQDAQAVGPGADAAVVAPGQDAQAVGPGADAGSHGAPTSGCGCAFGGQAIGSVFALAALLVLRRRRNAR